MFYYRATHARYLSVCARVTHPSPLPPPPSYLLPAQVILHTPRSLFALFENFDCCIRLGRPPQGGGGGGLLVGVAVNGLPLAEAPVVEVYGPSELLYSSTQEDDNHVVSDSIWFCWLWFAPFRCVPFRSYVSCFVFSRACGGVACVLCSDVMGG